MRAHIVENGVVVNTIVVDSLDFLPNLVSAEDGGAIGDRYENGQFVTPVIEIDPAVLAAQLRAQRNALLSASDWTQLNDAPVDRAAWAVYRQALRDVPQQAGFPTVIDWPVAPS